jgi:hypothetical protein
MNVSESNPRPTWRDSNVLMALGLAALALLPALARAQTGAPPEELKQREGIRFIEVKDAADIKQAAAELEKARAELAKLQAAVAQARDRIKAIEAKLAAAKAAEGAHDQKGGTPEIVIILRKSGDKWEIVPQPAKPQEKQPELKLYYRLDDKTGKIEVVPVEPGKVPQRPDQPLKVPELPGQPGWRVEPPTTKPGQAPGDRIDILERQLKKIVDELEELRKEMKQQPRPGGATQATPEELEKLGSKKIELEKYLKKIAEDEGLEFKVVPVEPKTKPPTRPEEKKPETKGIKIETEGGKIEIVPR